MTAIITLIFLSSLSLFGGAAMIESTNSTRGVGSWAEDRARIMLAGALYLMALVGYGIAISSLLSL